MFLRSFLAIVSALIFCVLTNKYFPVITVVYGKNLDGARFWVMALLVAAALGLVLGLVVGSLRLNLLNIPLLGEVALTGIIWAVGGTVYFVLLAGDPDRWHGGLRFLLVIVPAVGLIYGLFSFVFTGCFHVSHFLTADSSRKRRIRIKF